MTAVDTNSLEITINKNNCEKFVKADSDTKNKTISWRINVLGVAEKSLGLSIMQSPNHDQKW